MQKFYFTTEQIRLQLRIVCIERHA